MIDNLSLLLSHGLILVACIRLLSRPDLDNETPEERPSLLRPRKDGEPRDA